MSKGEVMEVRAKPNEQPTLVLNTDGQFNLSGIEIIGPYAVEGRDILKEVARKANTYYGWLKVVVEGE